MFRGAAGEKTELTHLKQNTFDMHLKAAWWAFAIDPGCKTVHGS